ncbi:MAG: beta-glucosidase [Flavobacterium sp.]|uniref:glucoamylase family protein n=1 Tax=Flavobacterium sp. TaxID=239 RepID=UPI0022CC7BC9|nr:glucoamylase family protein [Flavobacterium sp.]MCZ8196634.1 beta-glucosidase [Flavobacterium sp.]
MKSLIAIITLNLLLSCTSCTSSDKTTETPVVVTPEEPVIPIINDPVTPISDSDALDLVQKECIKYFWEYAHPVSKLAKERYHTDDPTNDANIVTTGGSGFGLMTIIAGVERGFVNRAEAVSRLTTALNFLETADRFHGAWPHWMNGTNGDVIPFGTNDNGGDLVETAFLCQGLITVREYFKNGNTEEQALAIKADDLWKGVEWDWYTKGENVLYWHWSPDKGWIMNFKLEGYNEALIVYVLAKASPTHPISNNNPYTQGWARNGGIKSTAQRFGIPVIFNHNGASGNVGPMFWAHYSHLGLDPRGLTDQYADYWSLNQNHAKIMLEHCKANPGSFTDYSDKCWGLTASYTRNSNGSTGYTAHQPNNDKGVITPTAALSNFPYTPVESMKFLKYLYAEHRARYVGVAGPYDAFSPEYIWKTPRYLAIDQGTIVPMIENYRTGLLWNLFMQAPDVKSGLISLGFSSTQHGF